MRDEYRVMIYVAVRAGVVGRTVSAVQHALRGYAGSQVKLLLKRLSASGEEKLITVDLVRGTPVFWRFQTGTCFFRHFVHTVWLHTGQIRVAPHWSNLACDERPFVMPL